MGTLLNRRRYMCGGSATVDWSQRYLTFKALGNGTFKIGSATQYSLDDGATWTSLPANTNSPTVSSGSTIMWKGLLTPTTNNGVGTFSSSNNFEAMGNPLSLLFGDNFGSITDLTGYDWAFGRLFRYCSRLYSVKDLSLPSTVLSVSCYREMFDSCTNLSDYPLLPALSLTNYCYYRMFYNTSIIDTPELPATILAEACYGDMFRNCLKLLLAKALPATQPASRCYSGMFYGCKALVQAPTIDLTATAYYCIYQMFRECESLEVSPVLKSLTLNGNLPYGELFYGCTNLRYIKALFTTTPTTGFTANWVYGVYATGTFVKNSAATWEVVGTYGVPSGWTIETSSE